MYYNLIHMIFLALCSCIQQVSFYKTFYTQFSSDESIHRKTCAATLLAQRQSIRLARRLIVMRTHWHMWQNADEKKKTKKKQNTNWRTDRTFYVCVSILWFVVSIHGCLLCEQFSMSNCDRSIESLELAIRQYDNDIEDKRSIATTLQMRKKYARTHKHSSDSIEL